MIVKPLIERGKFNLSGGPVVSGLIHAILLIVFSLLLLTIMTSIIQSGGLLRVLGSTLAKDEVFALQESLQDMTSLKPRIIVVGNAEFIARIKQNNSDNNEGVYHLSIPDYQASYIETLLRDSKKTYFGVEYEEIVFQNYSALWSELINEPAVSNTSLWDAAANQNEHKLIDLKATKLFYETIATSFILSVSGKETKLRKKRLVDGRYKFKKYLFDLFHDKHIAGKVSFVNTDYLNSKIDSASQLEFLKVFNTSQLPNVKMLSEAEISSLLNDRSLTMDSSHVE